MNSNSYKTVELVFKQCYNTKDYEFGGVKLKYTADKTSKQLGKGDKLGIAAIAVLVLLLVLLFAFGFSSKKDETAFVSSDAISTAQDVTTTPPPTFTTTEPVTTATVPPSTTETTESEEKTTEKTTAPTTTAPTTKDENSKEEILKKITEGINKLKASDASYVGTKTQNIVIDVTDCSYPAFLTIINGVVKLIANEEILEYDFTNGKCIDPEENKEVTANDTIPPVGTAFAHTVEGVNEAKVEKIGDNTKYTVVLVAEQGTFEQPKPTHHGVACDTLDFSLFPVPMGEITKSDFNYPGAIITVTYDKNGNVVGYSEHIDMNGVGEGQALGITATANLEGYIDESWEIVWK